MKSPSKNSPIIHGQARFTWLTSRLLRLEWASDGVFEDRPTLAVANRCTPAVKHTTVQEQGKLVSETTHLKVEYKDDGKAFHPKNLRISFTHKGKAAHWKPGQIDALNLGGTLRTLDGMNGDIETVWQPLNDGSGDWGPTASKKKDLPPGLLSRSGWSVFDDSGSVVIGPHDAAGASTDWVHPRSSNHKQDWYFLYSGLEYTAALKDASRVFGSQPLPPRYAFGYWYSRYWAYTDREIEALVQEFRERTIPLDVMVIDMDWHLPGWTGYTWDGRYFPNPKEHLSYLAEHGVKVTLNLHPADGVAGHEVAFTAFCKELGLDPSSTKNIPFDITDHRYMDAYFKHLHHPLQQQGVAFWWMDWQQGSNSGMTGLDPLPWLNILHWRDLHKANPRQRPIIFSRYGGLGSGRHPIGFSGDTASSWASLAYQTDFTATAANVLFGYWSHDIGGHMGTDFNAEMYTRWMQFATYSPIVRTHTTKEANALTERRLWAFPDPYGPAMVSTLRRRYALVPYIYSECWRGVESGISLLRPLYYQWPEEKQAYEAKGQYLFGEHMMVAPVTTPVEADGMAACRIWLPPGEWIDTSWGDLLEGNRWLNRRYLIEEVPVFVKPGTIIPEQGKVQNLCAPCYPELTFRIYTGANGAYSLYEDDGATVDYANAQFTELAITHKETARAWTTVIKPVNGNYAGYNTNRPVRFILAGAVAPKRISIDGKEIPWSHRPKAGHWSYQGDECQIVVDVGIINLQAGATLIVTPGVKSKSISALPGLLRRLEQVRMLACQASPAHPVHPDERLIVDLAQIGNRISRQPETLNAELANLLRELPRLPQVLREFHTALLKKAYNHTRAGVVERACKQLEGVKKQFPEYF
ncbi:MAG: glycoside hydrolase family 31 protein [Verrucomicrobiota bacterium]|nr:glycoside hydrolase family 31 protein [Verrucomicrobiota bacterium]